MKNSQTVGGVTVAHLVYGFLSIVIPPIRPLIVTDRGVFYTHGGLLLTVPFIMYLIIQLSAGIFAGWARITMASPAIATMSALLVVMFLWSRRQ